MTSCFVYRTKVESSARDVEELTKKLTQSESESVAFNRSTHTVKLQLQKRLETLTTESSGTIAELTAEVSRLSALVDGAETNGTSIFSTLVRAIKLTSRVFCCYSGGADASGIRVQIRKLTNRARQKVGR
jgi:hypothetical protein